MVNTALPEDLGSMGGRCYLHDAKQLRWAIMGVEDARKGEDVEMSMLQSRQLSDPKRGWKVGKSCNRRVPGVIGRPRSSKAT